MKTKINWKKIDLTRRTDELAKELNVSTGLIYQKRRAMNVKAPRAKHRFRQSRSGINWDEVDLTGNTDELVRKLRVSKQSISQQRRKRGVRRGHFYPKNPWQPVQEEPNDVTHMVAAISLMLVFVLMLVYFIIK